MTSPDATLHASARALPPAAPPATPAKPPLKKQLVGMAAGMAVGGVFGFLIAHFAFTPELGADTKAALRERYGSALFPLALAMMLVACWLAIALHEVGHLIGGLAVRFRFYFFVAGLLKVHRDERERLRVGRNRELPVFGGMVSMLPADTRDLPRRLGWLIAGGPAASLLVAALGIGAGYVPGLAPELRLGLVVLGVVSAGAFVIAIIPARASGFVTDGGRLLRLLKGGPEAEREAAMLPLVGLYTAGTPARQWPAELVRRSLEPRDGSSEECAARSLAFYHALDSGDVDGAAEHVDRMVELVGTYPPGFVPAIWAEAAYFEAAHRGRADVAREYLSRVPEKTMVVKEFERARAQAALALAEGDAAGAGEIARKALEQLPADKVFQKARLEEVVRRAEAARAVVGA